MSQAPQRQRRPDRAAFIIALALALVAGVITWSTSNMGTGGAYSQVGPATFPYVIAAILFVLAILTTISAWRGDFPNRPPENVSPVIWIVGGLVVQMLLLDLAGFAIATGFLFAATARAFGRGPLWFTLPIGIVLSFVIWVIFAKGLQLSLPSGPIEQLIFS
ncbi:tripartite tricarboxylate transporter TctB family protein [Mesorhizobium sp. NBSH29]|uniref:tripartite tricarboxylate transporter TctB family protein n=1 Tax=Mesorhizobium sp. NBSH29 TaxID=2654249 RepID=UPI00189646CA|nr:tripartite tricarboxylate transporter TctB family protein [Mesorhizobium sp. NBSH29]QPC86520.1 tripartite tricarboxylate transporter TctB family protein [Mesorhizobium sp. NBSH29]